MQKDILYRWSIKTDNVYKFAMFYGEGFNASTLASYKNEVSGFVSHKNLPALRYALLPYGYSFKDKNIRLLKSSTYMRHFDKYNL